MNNINKLDDELKELVKDRTVHLITTHKGLKTIELLSKISTDYLLLSDDDIQLIIHELVQENKLQRIEYIIKEYSSTIFAFYLPGNSRIL